MNKLSFRGTTNSSTQYMFLVKSYDALHAAKGLCGVLQERVDDKIESEAMLDTFERLWVSVDAKGIRQSGVANQLLSETGGHWYAIAAASFLGAGEQLMDDAEMMRSTPKDEVELHLQNFKTAIGGFSFAILDGLDMLSDLSTEKLSEDFDMSEGIRAFLQDRVGGSVIKFVYELYTDYTKYPPFIPVRLEYPEEWDDFCAMVEESELGTEILDYGDLLHLCDVKAILAGQYPVDDNLLAALKNRESSIYLPSKLYPHKYAQFLAAVPDALCYVPLMYENKLTEELINEVLLGKATVNAAFVEKLRNGPVLEDVYTDTTVMVGDKALQALRASLQDTHVF